MYNFAEEFWADVWDKIGEEEQKEKVEKYKAIGEAENCDDLIENYFVTKGDEGRELFLSEWNQISSDL